ncbi:hypothetical protein LX16_0709 [Stackebrandtia albiflava]|uniref:Uncharacterized protein n=1 Tax=Stackebrandtia albiflava TaxID=406432 RepID=A0A562VAV9_9ACTN|nr:hypothetical protein [Stackebrandtia albiflava]TWJ15012.1 hypothetical protein LX16_0709 [Stackebrandtia albiflava]
MNEADCRRLVEAADAVEHRVRAIMGADPDAYPMSAFVLSDCAAKRAVAHRLMDLASDGRYDDATVRDVVDLLIEPYDQLPQ